jgi:hypothetical protein
VASKEARGTTFRINFVGVPTWERLGSGYPDVWLRPAADPIHLATDLLLRRRLHRRSAAASTEPGAGSTSTCRADDADLDADELIKTVLRTNDKEVRKKHAAKAS